MSVQHITYVRASFAHKIHACRNFQLSLVMCTERVCTQVDVVFMTLRLSQRSYTLRK